MKCIKCGTILNGTGDDLRLGLCAFHRYEQVSMMTRDTGLVDKQPPSQNDAYTMLDDVARELTRASELFPAFNSLHEGYSILLEEMDELWDLVKKHQSRRDGEQIKKECIQIAAMALRIIRDCGAVGYNK